MLYLHMWIIQELFYLNYVKYKGKIITSKLMDAMRFILTMWNIKSIKQQAIGKPTLRFILTMWNIKLNLVAPIWLDTLRFILTMWNIKNGIEEDKKLPETGFILTMWNIKVIDWLSGSKPT